MNEIDVKDIPIKHYFGGGVYAKETHIKAGQILAQHKHAFDHLSILASGEVILRVDGQNQKFTGPSVLTIQANKHHGVMAVTDCVWYCIHGTDCTDASLIDELLIQEADKEEMQEILKALDENQKAI